ncbi:diguanylate cyclase [Undibacterium sp.]|jgi:two-component system cell cycle response regulator|uniref:GGDEF domain-containing response regulator n=1 Tax=Undibacterium sp. TaxID=1914977 RepID=UPI002BE89D72|nr:diguanylate cyclase [Undibacterium sp.]HTD04594.1 diguanylate cyclase [Undibacterium sp.]
MKILIADDEPISLLYLQAALEDWGYQVVTASDGNQACEILQGQDAPMLAVIDWMMPGMDGIDVCRVVRESVKDRYVYMIMLTGKSETEFIVQAMDAGADDFISKPFNMDELQVRVRAGRRIAELEQKLRIKASHDALTGLYNRGAIMEILQKELTRHQRNRQSFAIIFGDLDHFKRINDDFGHLAGDAVLREAAGRISSVLRPYDSLGRYGGEELLIVLPGCDASEATEIAERVRQVICSKPIVTDAGDVPASLSMGVAVVAQDQQISFNGLIHLADEALYIAKDKGRNRVELAI